MKVSGFTLIEILIALAIFALLSVISAVGLRSLLATQAKVRAANERLRQVVSAVMLIRRDVRQSTGRLLLDARYQFKAHKLWRITRGGMVRELLLDEVVDFSLKPVAQRGVVLTITLSDWGKLSVVESIHAPS